MNFGRNDADNRYLIAANILILFSVVIFMAFLLFGSFVHESDFYLVIIAGTIAIILLILAMTFLRNRKNDSGVVIPLIMYFGYTGVCIAISNYSLFFVANYVLSALAMLYCSKTGFLRYLVITIAINFIFFFKGLPLTSVTKPGYAASPAEIYMNVCLYGIYVIVLFLLIFFMSNKTRRLERADSAFAKLFSTTPNIIA
jgi:hypothetical protein